MSEADYDKALAQRAEQQAALEARLGRKAQDDEARRLAKAERAARRERELPAAREHIITMLVALADVPSLNETERELLRSAIGCVRGMR